MKKVLTVLAVLSILGAYALFALGSGSDDATVKKSDSDEDSTVTQEKAENAVVNIGERLTVGGLEINYVS